MNILLAVLEDLYTFARDTVLSIVPTFRRKTPPEIRALPPVAQTGQLEAAPTDTVDTVAELPDEQVPLTFRSAADILEHPHAKNTVMYTGTEHTPLFSKPTMEFDGVITRLPYGTMVMVLESRGRWSRVAHTGKEGWVLRDDLSDRAAHVYPDFTIGVENRADDPNTLRVRACIEDEFGAGKAELPLQSSEYVLYRLYKKGIQIAWPDVRPRIEGLWHELLKGRAGVQIGIGPCGGCIMEYIYESGEGHLAYVEAVFPDETLSISEVNYPADGIYNERVLTREEWIELKPVFIEFS